jgi:hypothetical protein
VPFLGSRQPGIDTPAARFALPGVTSTDAWLGQQLLD